jgi:hypothetical protein
MNPTQIFKFARIWIKSENRQINLSASRPKPRSAQMHSGAWPMPAAWARPMRIVRARPMATRARPALAGPTSASAARDGAAHAGAVTAPRRMSWCKRRRSSTHDGEATHRTWGRDSLELLVDGEEKKSGSAAAFLRRGGATVASGGPATMRGEGS